MIKYRKKPVEIEATQLTKDNWKELAEWIHIHHIAPRIVKDGTLVISTLEGHLTANIGDYIIRGVKGGFYPCKPDIFEMTYDKVDC